MIGATGSICPALPELRMTRTPSFLKSEVPSFRLGKEKVLLLTHTYVCRVILSVVTCRVRLRSTSAPAAPGREPNNDYGNWPHLPGVRNKHGQANSSVILLHFLEQDEHKLHKQAEKAAAGEVPKILRWTSELSRERGGVIYL